MCNDPLKLCLPLLTCALCFTQTRLTFFLNMSLISSPHGISSRESTSLFPLADELLSLPPPSGPISNVSSPSWDRGDRDRERWQNRTEGVRILWSQAKPLLGFEQEQRDLIYIFKHVSSLVLGMLEFWMCKLQLCNRAGWFSSAV